MDDMRPLSAYEISIRDQVDAISAKEITYYNMFGYPAPASRKRIEKCLRDGMIYNPNYMVYSGDCLDMRDFIYPPVGTV